MSIRRATSRVFWSARAFWGIAAIVVAWEVSVRAADLNPIVMPKPSSILLDILYHADVYLVGALQTSVFAVAGLFLGMLIGTLLSILAWLSRFLNGLLTPVAIILASVPVVAMIPILARIFGYDIKTVVVIVAIISFFPAFVFTNSGLRSLPAGSDDLFTVLGVGTFRRLFYLALPSAIPEWTVALRLVAANAILSAIVAEFLMGTSGLGHIFAEARASLDMVSALGASAVAAVISIFAFLGASAVERWAQRVWK